MKVVLNICTKNNIDTINYTLNAIVKQTRYPDLVVFVDASTDGTTEILEKFSKEVSFPVKIIKQKNGGVGKARQLFYEFIKDKDFDLAVFLDTEKIPKNDWLEKHVKLHEEYPHVDIVCGTPIVKGCKLVYSPFQNNRYLVQGNCSIKIEALKKVNGWDENFKRGEDWDLALRLFKDAKAVSLLCENLSVISLKRDSVSTFIKKILNKPLSFDYLVKYGWWYFVNYPQHVFGDLIFLFYLLYLIFSLFNLIFLNNIYYILTIIILYIFLLIGISKYRNLSFNLLILVPWLYSFCVLKYICKKFMELIKIIIQS